MKNYTVNYTIGQHNYESVIRTTSSAAVFLWVKTIGGSNPYIVSEE